MEGRDIGQTIQGNVVGCDAKSDLGLDVTRQERVRASGRYACDRS